MRRRGRQHDSGVAVTSRRGGVRRRPAHYGERIDTTTDAGPAAGAGRWLLACDLDQTLIYSRHAWRLPAGAAEPDVAAVELIDGRPAAFSTARMLALLAQVRRSAVFVPVTTRTLAQYARVDLGERPRYAVAANGGHLLVDGVPDPAWAAAVSARIAGAARPLAQVHERALRLAADGWARLVRVADGLFVYLVAHDRDGIPDLSGLARELAGDGWSLSVQGRKVYLVPSALTKTAAVAEVARRAGTARLAAAGDSLLDRPLLAVADVAVRPAHGELHDVGWVAPNLTVTSAAGILGGQELMEALAAATGGRGAGAETTVGAGEPPPRSHHHEGGRT
jgi:hydroxymethylpyrimidine pyrophosphatase-like HAD family hydrolase